MFYPYSRKKRTGSQIFHFRLDPINFPICIRNHSDSYLVLFQCPIRGFIDEYCMEGALRFRQLF